jgi:FKBP-type peptidyl-prolyl cis-trans isomerase
MMLRALLIACLSVACFFRPEPPEYPSVITDSGLVRQDLVVPEQGPRVVPGDTVAVHFELRLPDGSLVESSHDAGEPLRFQVGSGEVPTGLSEGVEGMKRFGRRLLVVPPHLGYGAVGMPPAIPPGATLTFEVELMEHEPAGQAGG